ncbi:MAG: CPBP family intramembrane glutamic endopeptidase [Planctomycetota bacterium]
MPRSAPSGNSAGRSARSRRSGSDPTGGRLRAPDRRRQRPSTEPTPGEQIQRYLELSKQPLQILVFLLPLVLFYQIGTWSYSQMAAAAMTADGSISGSDVASGEMVAEHPSTVISAWQILHDLFGIFGVASLYLPGGLLVTVLLVWHIISRDRWRVHAGVPLVMVIESLLLALPLLVLDQLVARFAGAEVIAVPAFALSAGETSTAFVQQAIGVAMSSVAVTAGQVASPESILATHTWLARLVISVGAGVYEELLFRLVVIELVHLIAVHLLQLGERTAAISAMVVSALLFAFYHDLSPGGTGGPGIELRLLLFYFLAGIYFAALLVVRGFGIVVGAHAVYDCIVIVILPAIANLLSSSGPTTSAVGVG